MPICPLKEILVTLLFPPVHTGHEEIPSKQDFNQRNSDKIHSSCAVKLI